MLVRRFVNASFRLLMRTEWDAAVCAEYNSILTDHGGPLWYASPTYVLRFPSVPDSKRSPEDNRVPVSLAYHLADIYLEELDKALGRTEDALPAPLNTLLEPFLTLASRTINKKTYERLQSALLEPLLSAFSPSAASEEEDQAEDGDDEGRSRKRRRLSEPCFAHVVANVCASDPKAEGAMAPKTVKKALLKRIFDVAGAETTRDVDRRKLYALWKNHADEDEELS
jgi:ribosomal RNA-processing protein 1